jgi:autotransporter-associated beta strand protein
MTLPARPCLPQLAALVAAAIALFASAAHGQSPETLDGTSGTSTITSNYSLSGTTTFNLGFFVDYLIVGGGGGGGRAGGGGGAGGLVEGTALQLSASSYPVTVGGGGAGGTASAGAGTGGNSVFGSGTANGGGGGGAVNLSGSAGGSGGGGGSQSGVAGSSNKTSGFGNDGGNGSSATGGADLGGGGGGGAGAAGATAVSGGAGRGGNGRASTITGSSVDYAGGGGGGRGSSAPNNGAGGSGGGGNGGFGSTAATAGVDGRGGGGGGGGAVPGTLYNGAAGGDGVVIVRYAGAAVPGVGGSGTSFVGNGTIGVSGVTYQVVTYTNAVTSSFDISSVNFTTRLGASLTGTISGTGEFLFNGPGTLTLSASNSFTGTTRSGSGTLLLGNVNALRPSVLDMNTADSGSIGFSAAGTNTYFIGGLSGGRPLNLGANTIDVGGSGTTTTYAGTLAGTGSLVKSGAGTFTLTGSNTYSGGTTISAGTLAVALIADSGASNIGTSGTLGLAGGTLRYTGATTASTARVVDIATSSTASAIEVVDPSATLTLSGKVWNSGTAHSNVVVSKTGAGTLGIAGAGGNVGLSLAAREGVTLLASTTNAVYEIRALDAGATVRLQNNFQIFGGDAISTTGNIRMTGGTLDLNGFNETVNRVSGADFSTAGTGTITSATPATFTFGNNLAGRPSRFAGTISGSLSVAVKGTNPITLSANNPYAGTTTIQDAGTQLRIGVGGTTGSLGTGAVVNGGELLFDRSDVVTVSNAISGSGSLTQAGAGTLTLSGTNTYSGTTTISAGRLVGSTASLPGAIANASQLEFAQAAAGMFAAAISGTGSFTKSGAGNLILSATSTFTGPTSVAAGLLSVNGALGNTAVTVASGAELGGSGSIVGALAVLSGGTLAPGNSIDSLAGGATSFAAGSTFGYEVNSSLLGSLGTAADLLVVSGNLDIASGSLLTFADITSGTVQPFVEDTTVFAMISYSGNWNGGLFTYGGSPLANGSTFTAGSQDWRIDYNSSTGGLNYTGDYLPTSKFVTVTAVPEPSTFVLGALGFAGAVWLRRWRLKATVV